MSTSTIEAKKEIINKAPKGATHYILLQHDLWEIYARLEGVEFKTLIQGEWVTPDDFDLNEIGLYDLQSLADMQEIIDLHEQNIAMAAVIESQQKMLKQAQQEYIEQHSDGEAVTIGYSINAKGIEFIKTTLNARVAAYQDKPATTEEALTYVNQIDKEKPAFILFGEWTTSEELESHKMSFDMFDKREKE